MFVHVSTSAHCEIIMSTRSAVSDRYMYLLTDRLLLFGIYCRLELFYNGCHARHKSPDVVTRPLYRAPPSRQSPAPRGTRTRPQTLLPSVGMMNDEHKRCVSCLCGHSLLRNKLTSEPLFMFKMFPVPEQLIYGSALVMVIHSFSESFIFHFCCFILKVYC